MGRKPAFSVCELANDGDDVIIAAHGTETLNGGGGNDILAVSSGSHVMTGGTGNDTFAFLQANATGTITDFNNKIVNRRPDSPEKVAAFEQRRAVCAPTKKKVETYFELIDLEEDRIQ